MALYRWCLAFSWGASNANSNCRGSPLMPCRWRFRCVSERRRIERELATSWFVGKPLARNTDKRAIRAGLIVDAELHAVVVAEIKLGQISVKVLFFNVLVNAIRPRLNTLKKPSSVLVCTSPRTHSSLE